MRVADNGPGIARPRRGAVGPLSLGDRDGPRHRRRAAADGPLHGGRRRRRGTTVDAEEAAAAAQPALIGAASSRGWRAELDRRAARRPDRARSSSRTRNCCARSTSCDARQEELERAQPRARGHQPRRRRALRRARRARRSPAARRRDQDAVPVEHDARVPDAGELDSGADATCSPNGCDADPDEKERALLHPQVGAAAVGARGRPARSREGRSRQDRRAAGVVRGRRRCSARCAACCGRCSSISRSTLVFEEPEGIPPLYSDESKVSQILRNFISNALKYTEHGEVRVAARLTPARRRGGVLRRRHRHRHSRGGLARIFDEFVQIENPLQRRVKGTGLGLPLSKRLAELLGGRIGVREHARRRLDVLVDRPARLPRRRPAASMPRRSWSPGSASPCWSSRTRTKTCCWSTGALSGTALSDRSTRGRQAPQRRSAVRSRCGRPPSSSTSACTGDEAWDLLARLKRDAGYAYPTGDRGVHVDERRKGCALGADAYFGRSRSMRRWLVRDARPSRRRAQMPVRVLSDRRRGGVAVHHPRAAERSPSTSWSRRRRATTGCARAREAPPDVILLDLRLHRHDRLRCLSSGFGRIRRPPVSRSSWSRRSGCPRTTSGACPRPRRSSRSRTLTRNSLRSAIASAVMPQPRL